MRAVPRFTGSRPVRGPGPVKVWAAAEPEAVPDPCPWCAFHVGASTRTRIGTVVGSEHCPDRDRGRCQVQSHGRDQFRGPGWVRSRACHRRPDLPDLGADAHVSTARRTTRAVGEHDMQPRYRNVNKHRRREPRAHRSMIRQPIRQAQLGHCDGFNQCARSAPRLRAGSISSLRAPGWSPHSLEVSRPGHTQVRRAGWWRTGPRSRRALSSRASHHPSRPSERRDLRRRPPARQESLMPSSGAGPGS